MQPPEAAAGIASQPERQPVPVNLLTETSPKNDRWMLPGLFLAGRLALLAALPQEGLRGFGDFVHFYRLAGMGWPYLDYWVEFPPLFPFLSALLYRLAGGREHVYDYLLALILTLAQAATLAVFVRLAGRMHTPEEAGRRGLVYFSLLLALPYGWWYFDPLAVLAMLLGLTWLFAGRDLRAGAAITAGILLKLFPVLVLALAWRWRSFSQAVRITLLALGLAGLVYAGLWALSPEYTAASFGSQGSKGSWETIWALLDGNLNTGNFGPETERFDPAAAFLPQGSPPRLPPALILIPFALLGGWFFWRARIINERAAVAFLTLTWAVFLVWSPGWSPQWVLYLLPLILLALPFREALLLALALVFINLLEWPVLLSRGLFWGLWLTIPVRTLLFVLLGVESWRLMRNDVA
jgi:hypothetical protein